MTFASRLTDQLKPLHLFSRAILTSSMEPRNSNLKIHFFFLGLMPNDLESMAGMSIAVRCDDEKEPEPSNDLKEASPCYYVSTYEWQNKKTSSYQIDV